MKFLMALVILPSLHFSSFAKAGDYCRIEVADNTSIELMRGLLDKKFLAIRHTKVVENGNPPSLVLETEHGTEHNGYVEKPYTTLKILDRTGNILSNSFNAFFSVLLASLCV